MDYTNIIVETGSDFIATITLNRPKSLNTFNMTLATELDAALRALDADKAVRVVIIKGSGKAFCAGIDVSDFFGKDLEAYRAWIACMEQPFVTIAAMQKPVIAMVHGVAAANGRGYRAHRPDSHKRGAQLHRTRRTGRAVDRAQALTGNVAVRKLVHRSGGAVHGARQPSRSGGRSGA